LDSIPTPPTPFLIQLVFTKADRFFKKHRVVKHFLFLTKGKTKGYQQYRPIITINYYLLSNKKG